ncbi:thioredoxin family protein [Salinimicrobium flavum]|uniref:Thioredoxin family protein n=1 Tax=Salinimicrobium flavum TaxID=1737065 RepID=A0ABW5IV23_9FLAO
MHRIIFLLLVAVFSGSINAQEIKWMTMNEALEAQKKEPRKIFMDAYTEWCGPCKLLDRNTFSNKDVASFLNENYYPVKFNAEGTEKITYKDRSFENPNHDPNRKGRNSQHDFARAMKITGYPSLVFFDEEANLIGPIAGYRSPHQLELFLKLFLEEDYKEITTPEAFQEYSKNFKNEFIE